MRSNAWPETAFAALVACSLEAAWITLVYVTIRGLATRTPTPLPILAFAGAAVGGLVLARWSTRHRGVAFRTPLAVIVVAAALIGWLLPLGPAAAHVLEEPIVVLGMHPGGILLGVAVLRGTAHVTRDDDERIADLALGPGLAVVAATWVLLTATGATHEPAIVGVAFSSTVTFVTAGLLSIGLARAAGLRHPATVGTGGRTWTWLVVAVVAILLAVSMPLALLLGVPLGNAIRGTLGPVGEILIAVVTLLLWPAGLLAAAIVVVLQSLLGDPTGASTPGVAVGPGDVDWGSIFGTGGAEGLVLGVLPLVIAVVALLLVVRGLLRRSGLGDAGEEPSETHEIEPPSGALRLRLPRLPLPHRHHVPGDASEAYLASLEVVSHRPESARRDSETPAEHARRLRADPIGLPLSRLAADYALAEFGGRTLTPTEHRRAVERWRRIRSTPGP